MPATSLSASELISTFGAARSLADKVKALIALGLKPSDVARTAGMARGSNAALRWADGEEPRKNSVVPRVNDLFLVAEQLVRCGMYEPDDIVAWLEERNRALGWESPLEALRNESEFRVVIALAEEICSLPSATEPAHLEAGADPSPMRVTVRHLDSM